MGLKTTNYEVKSLGITLPEAYAIIKDIHITRNSALVTIVIQCSRENALEKTPIETKQMHFTVNRNENPFVTAYNLAKGRQVYESKDSKTGETVTRTLDGILYGWEDDIVTE